MAAPPGIAVTRVPVPFAAALAPAVVDALTRWGRPLRDCRPIVIALVGAHIT